MTRKMSLRRALLLYSVIVVVLIWTVFPLYLTITTSFKLQKDALSRDPRLFLFTPTLNNYVEIYKEAQLSKHYVNSVMVTLGSVALSLLIGIPAAYALARYRFPGKRTYSFVLFLTRIFPPIALLVPLFILWARLGLIDSLGGLTLIYVQVNLSLVVWMLTGFFEDLPRTLEEAAMIDGCTRVEAFFRVLLPLAAPGLAATAVLVMIFSWNEFMFAFALTGRTARTAPVTIYNFIEFEGIKWGQLQAAGFLVTLPVLVFTLLVEKYLVKGLTQGSFK